MGDEFVSDDIVTPKWLGFQTNALTFGCLGIG
jgi:hypothetical protein